ncbi:MAG: 50S ribosomal protein L29 [Acidobacteria bacterium]|jgi:large subunit ribosomal protein L29|nr:50S ribosomal protein L29 [Acidobacteriota bacterium]
MKVTEQVAELRVLSVEDLQLRAADLEEQAFRTRIQASMGQTESANKMRPIRRELARIQTLLREKGVRY